MFRVAATPGYDEDLAVAESAEVPLEGGQMAWRRSDTTLPRVRSPPFAE